MADNFGGGENIFFTEDSNIVLIDPNSIRTPDGTKKDRVIRQENLVMYANLEVESVPRTKLSVGRSLDSGINNSTIASINFMKPQGKNSFDTSYTDQLTGGKNAQGVINQLSYDNNNNPQQENYVDTQTLGITSINVNIPFNGVPEVSMTLTDIQGRALFETGGNSPYSVFMYYPYPLFRLTLKGYYGKAIQYKLMLRSFNATFDARNGNYNIDLKFIARTSAILDDVRLGYLFSLPYMYPIYEQPIVQDQVTSAAATSSVQQLGTGVVQTNNLQKTSKGYSKLKQVFEQYKRDGLIDESVPVLTLEEMSVNLTKYTQFLNEQFEKLDFTNVVALARYRDSLDEFVGKVTNWENEYLDKKDTIILTDGTILYGLKKTIADPTSPNNADIANKANTALTGITQQYKSQLESIPIWGTQITRPEDFFDLTIFQRRFTEFEIEYEKTYKERRGLSITSDRDPRFLSFKTDLVDELKKKGTLPPNLDQSIDNPYYYTLNTFTEYSVQQGVVVDQNKEQQNQLLNQTLQNRVKTNPNTNNLTFRPTIRNVIGVIMASVDAFYRMMDDVHKQAWDQRANPSRIKSILKTNTPTSEGKNNVQSTQTNNPNQIVYPWPQFVQQAGGGKGEYEIKYPGSLDSIYSTRAYDKKLWPEVDFVEQFLYGLTQKKVDYNTDVQQSASVSIKYTPYSATEFKFQQEIYSNKSVPNFIYEIYERILANTFYSGLYYIDITTGDLPYVGSEIETSNIVNSAIPEGDLRRVLLEELPNKTLYDYLLTTAGTNLVGPSWNKFTAQTYNTQYINSQINKSTEIYSEKTYFKGSKNPIKLDSQKNIIDFLSANTSTTTTLFDTYPFISDNFQNLNMEKGGNYYNTTNTYNFDTGNLFISNQQRTVAPYTKKQSNNKGFYSTVINDNSINTFFLDRYKKGEQRMITEGNLSTGSVNSLLNAQTTSMFNTPYFLNALLSTGQTRSIQLGYLFLNSLPLSTLYEKYLDTTNGAKTDYIFASLSQFSAVHKIPYAWILKTGSLWYRYKQVITNPQSSDILKNIWKDFDYKKAYDPQTNNPQRVYKIIKNNSSSKSDYQLNNANNINTGFYPGLYDSFFEYLSGTDLFNNDVDTKNNDFWSKNLKIITNVENSTLTGPITSHYGYFKIDSDYSDFFGPENVGKILLMPSAGYTPFQQSYYETTPNNVRTTEVDINKVNVPQTYNGSAKLFWECPNYGWFNNNDVDYPQYDEYLKIVDAGIIGAQQYEFFLSKQNYSKIEDLFGVFSKEDLDLFEKEFLTFCGDGEISELFLNEEVPDTTLYNLRDLLKRIFIVDTQSSEITEISKKQTENLTAVLNQFIDIPVYLKLGNPKKFDRYHFGNFISASPTDEINKMSPQRIQTYGTYVKDTLPGAGQNVTKEESESKNPQAWLAMKLHLGFSTIKGIEYGANSYIYDFFIDNNIAFNEGNVKSLSKLIKIYATQKLLNDGNYNSTKFKSDITALLRIAYNNRTTIENQLRLKLPNALLAGPQAPAIEQSKFYGDSTKLEMWELFKALNDKWVAGVDFNDFTLFDEFLFFDRANRDIGDDFIIKVDTIRKYCDWKNSNTSVMSLIRQILVENRMNFFVMPAYINFYGKPSKRFTDRTQTILNNANDVFSTFGYVDYIDSAPKFLCQYIGRPSQTLSMDNDPNYQFKSDSFDLGVSGNNPIRNTNTSINEYRSNKAVGFVVDFGVTNQSVFQSISLSQNQNITSSEQIQTVVDMGKLGGNKKTSQQTVSLFELYKNRTYDCTITTIGNVMIQPTMYFVLRHTPMFNGTYIIRKVTHKISPGSFQTELMGQRLSALSNEQVYNELADLNEDFDKKLDSRVSTLVSNNQLVTLNSNRTKYVTGQDAKNVTIASRVPYQGGIVDAKDLEEQSCNVNLYGFDTSEQSKLRNVNYLERVYTLKNISDELKNVNDKNMRLFLFSLLFLSGYKTSASSFTIKLNNLYGASGDIEWNTLNNISGYRCLNYTDVSPRPYLYFKSISECISFMSDYFKVPLDNYMLDKKSFPCLSKSTFTIDNLNATNKSCLADVYTKLFYNYWNTSLKENQPNANILEYNKVTQYAGTWIPKVTRALQIAVEQGLNK